MSSLLGRMTISEVFPFLNDYYSDKGGYFVKEYYSNTGGYFLKECPEFDIYRDQFSRYMKGGTVMVVEGKSCYHVEDVARFARYILANRE